MTEAVEFEEVYNTDYGAVRARGIRLNGESLQVMLSGPVRDIIQDEAGKDDIREMLGSIATTGFETEGLEVMLTDESNIPDWLVGEALAEVFVAEVSNCKFPWPTGRDLKNPEASPAGADLVGFQKTNNAELPYRFAFGEVKTSQEEKWPPQVVYGRGGLQDQINGLTHSEKVKRGLFCYLGYHAKNAAWLDMFTSAASRYLQSGQTDAALFGLLVRDVNPDARDLRQRAINSAEGKPDRTTTSFYALYLPIGCIPSLPELMEEGVIA
ncbi:hypothetical protein [Sansalvadorimonas verongulae]|uniref:hypothetical protein n=1 Tax=Sansalvadorimonas verongulae TaxID=2172824 RepID=UPI0012BBCA23|nr:hypothetical protein [Sansalvadorimonas verongulae]MTI15553.1 hypothetical protein [Sansalvadorimonas verongulae]